MAVYSFGLTENCNRKIARLALQYTCVRFLFCKLIEHPLQINGLITKRRHSTFDTT